ncbi:HTTM domain-containing protein [Telmatocola sphagniphila]|uniref:HTTM domain-containing protein n=1 Tax=Telmatocola sphagniphila TaxID=1123043 RepID=A0A8E6ET45_9BACT|nr:HTTM domain-containing protein [Telmatocola sphagniphila]QVL31939.1 HTTM domain-containing protein [Telmatocola sphagniphila]
MAKKHKTKPAPTPVATSTPVHLPAVASSTRPSYWFSWIQVFAIDARSLGLFRIILGLLLLADLVLRAVDLEAFYSDEGVMPRLTRIANYELNDTTGLKYLLSLHMVSGQNWWQILLFSIFGLFSFSLMIGYRTRLSALVSYVMLCSLQSRNPIILDGGDVYIRVMLFWGLFLPMNMRFSVDRWLRPEPEPPLGVLNLATFAMLTQVGYVYAMGAVLKNDAVWTRDYTAMYYAMSLECFSTWLGKWLVHQLVLTKFLTFVTWWLELVGPILLLLPFWNRYLRIAVILGFWGFHMSTEETLHLSIFPFIGCMAWIPFIPACVWDAKSWPGKYLVPFFGALVQPIQVQIEAIIRAFRPYFRKPEAPYFEMGRVAKIFVGITWIYVLLWNLREIPKIGQSVMPLSWNVVGRLLHVDQNWDMFAPKPTTDDGWYVMKAILLDGTEVNLWDLDQPVTLQKPESVQATYINRRWRKYLLNIYQGRFDQFRQPFALWLAVRWENAHPDRGPEKRIKTIQIDFMLDEVLPPGVSRPAPRLVNQITMENKQLK